MLLVKSISVKKSLWRLKVLLLFSILFLFANVRIHSQGFRAGVFGVSQFCLGDNSEYFLNASGLGLSGEFAFFKHFGISATGQYAQVIPASNSPIVFANQITFFLGIWGRVPLFGGNISLQQSIEPGMIYQSAKVKSEYDPISSKPYTDFVIQIVSSFRYSPPALWEGALEFEIAPVYTFIPMKKNVISDFGARLGVFYKF